MNLWNYWIFIRDLGNRSSSIASSSRTRSYPRSKTGLACYQSTTPWKESKNASQGDRSSSDPCPCRSGSTEAWRPCLGAVETYVISSYFRWNENESCKSAANPLLRPTSAINSPSTAPATIPHEPPPRAGLFGILHLALSYPWVHLTLKFKRRTVNAPSEIMGMNWSKNLFDTVHTMRICIEGNCRSVIKCNDIMARLFLVIPISPSFCLVT